MQTSGNNYISKFFETPGFKLLFNQHYKLVKKSNKKFATCEFLRNCLNSDVIPNTFKIRNKPANFGSNEFKQTWLEEAKEQSKRWMQNSIDDMNDCCLKLFNERDKIRDKLLKMVTTVDKLFLQEFLVKQNRKLLCQALKTKDNKIKHIRSYPEITVRSQQNSDREERGETERTQATKKKNRPGLKQRKYKSTVLKKLQKKTPVSIIFNYSSVELSDAAVRALNKGLNFCIKPTNVDMTEILADHLKFSRRMQWTEQFYNENEETEESNFIPSIFKQEKTNFPSKSNIARPLHTFLNTVESNLQNRTLWNKKHLNPKIRNLPDDEFEAIQNLVRLQKERQIVVKPADKGSGIVVVDYDDYVDSCNQHLLSSQQQPSGPSLPYYKPSSEKDLDTMKQKITSVLKDGLNQKWISKSEFNAMNPTDKGPGRFYQIFKVHKEYEPGSIPPGRPIVSGNGSITENISRFVDAHAKKVIHEIPAFIEDTPDFLRTLKEYNESGNISDTDILVTMDVSQLYTNIRHEDGIASMQSALDHRSDKSVPTLFLIQLLQLVLTCNVFQFDKSLFLQACGTAMGTACAPNYATIMMHSIDLKIKDLAKRIAAGGNPLILLKRFLDDIFMIWRGSVENLERFLELVNTLHPTIKFTSTFTCPFPCTYPADTKHDCFCHSSRSIPFLDTLVTIKNKTLVTDVYKKPTDRCQYLLPTSSHPAHITQNIPFSLCYRLVRICSEKNTLIQRLEELKQLLLSRNYDLKIINGAITKSLNIDRNTALQKKTKVSTKRIPFVITYHPALPAISTILKQGWRTMVKDERLKKIFPEPPLVAYRQPKHSSIREILVKSKLPEREKRCVKGMKKCNLPNCPSCPHIRESKVVYSSANNFRVTISTPVSCSTKNLVYVITCDKKECKHKQYIGETGKQLKERFKQHLDCVRSQNENLNKTAVAEHFNLPGHSVANMKVSVIENCKQESTMYRKCRESFFINKFETKHLGLNRRT